MKTITINLNEERHEIVDDITILPLADLHLGDNCCDLTYFKYAVNKIKIEPNTYTVLNGDLMNMALKSSKSDVYISTMTPNEQINKIVELLEPIKEKILFIDNGNHENRVLKEDGINVLEQVAYRLGIHDRYTQDWAYLYLYMGMGDHYRPIVYTITAYHGTGGGRKTGGKVNRLEEMSQVVVADLYIMSHTHKPLCTKGIIYTPDFRNKGLVAQKLNYLMTNSFLKYQGSYGESLGMAPQSTELTEAVLGAKVKTIKLTI